MTVPGTPVAFFVRLPGCAVTSGFRLLFFFRLLLVLRLFLFLLRLLLRFLFLVLGFLPFFGLFVLRLLLLALVCRFFVFVLRFFLALAAYELSALLQGVGQIGEFAVGHRAHRFAPCIEDLTAKLLVEVGEPGKLAQPLDPLGQQLLWFQPEPAAGQIGRQQPWAALITPPLSSLGGDSSSRMRRAGPPGVAVGAPHCAGEGYI
ncbi:hypothetical protein [Streptomyces sp900116325]|uniref:hypothetical protein n=1 Tax=Streptomyces sp. 900116325 TaxID=3154295 RepID=UPI00339E252C